MNILEQLEIAINEQKSIEFDYMWEWIRVWNPYAVFSESKSNSVVVDVFQFAWFRNNDQIVPEWRPFLLKNISSVYVLNERFIVLPWYDADSERYRKAIYKI